jgi:Ca2+-binding EF-hand superfamily protein
MHYALYTDWTGRVKVEMDECGSTKSYLPSELELIPSLLPVHSPPALEVAGPSAVPHSPAPGPAARADSARPNRKRVGFTACVDEQKEVDLGKVYPFNDARFFHVMLDLLDVFNCMYLGLYLEHFAYRCYEVEQYLLIVVLPLPSLVIMFVVVPDVMRLCALMASVTAMDELVLSDTLAYMREEEELTAMVRGELLDKLRVSLIRKASWMGEQFDDSQESYVHREQALEQATNGEIPERKLRLMFSKLDVDHSGGVSLQELRLGLANVFHLHFTSHQFLGVMRVLDPDQSGDITFLEFMGFMQGDDIKDEAAAKIIDKNSLFKPASSSPRAVPAARSSGVVQRGSHNGDSPRCLPSDVQAALGKQCGGSLL